MKRVVLWLLAVVLVAAAGLAALALVADRRFASSPFGQGTRVVQLPLRSGPRAVARLLAQAGVVSDADKFYLHLHFFRRGQTPRAGEYEFALPLQPDEVLSKLVRGEVKLYRLTVPEGLRADEIAALVGATSVCSAHDFLELARSAQVARRLNVPAPSLEGYLFPDTYTFPRSAGCQGIAQAMVARFQKGWAAAQAQRLPEVTLSESEAVTLGSIIEKETGQPEERPRISCVFHNRLKKRIPLATDPTVIYAVLLQNDFHWDGNLHRSDLLRPHPYNTYLNRGLPPGPIANPGEAALAAALHPMICDDLFFVSRNDHTHVFCPDLRCHERNVQKFQVEYFRKRKRG